MIFTIRFRTVSLFKINTISIRFKFSTQIKYRNIFWEDKFSLLQNQKYLKIYNKTLNKLIQKPFVSLSNDYKYCPSLTNLYQAIGLDNGGSRVLETSMRHSWYLTHYWCHVNLYMVNRSVTNSWSFHNTFCILWQMTTIFQ